MKKKFIAYEGPEYTLEWYWDARGKSSVLEYFENLDKERALRYRDDYIKRVKGNCYYD